MPSSRTTPALARVLLVGAGRVGTAVTSLLASRGLETVAVASRSEASSAAAARFLGAPVARLDDLPEADLVIIGATDAGIAPLAAKVASSPSATARVVHLSGASGTECLDAVTRSGGIAWALHPVQACPDVDTAVRRLPGSVWGVTVTADPEGAERLVVHELGGRPVTVPEEARPLWHAASVMTSNGISALLAFGEELLGSIGIDDPSVVLGPLAAGTVANAREGGGGAATLTGPIARGEAGTIQRHLGALSGSPDLAERYKGVAMAILAAADRSGKLDASARRSIEDLLR
jgi:predicted short-subunit dehydrogenase-like oxidoreductase (DUF2520 family)